ncbi:MAG: VWA domain-containing protein [Solirubrobacteraceae bacterium]
MHWTPVAIVVALLAALTVALSAGGPSTVPRASAQGDRCTPPDRLGVVFVIDDSGSMSNGVYVGGTSFPASDPGGLRRQATKAGLDRLADGYAAGIVSFSSAARTVQSPVILNGKSRDGAKRSLGDGPGAGGTDYGAAFGAAAAQLDDMPGGVDRSAVVFLSDGRPEGGSSADAALAQIKAKGAPIYTIGLGPGVDPGLLQGIATQGGGKYHKLDAASQITPIFGSIISELTCDRPIGGGDGTLDPGQSASYPFTVEDGTGSVEGQVSWDSGKVDVSLKTPGGRTATPDNPRGVKFTTEGSYTSFQIEDPRAGEWQVTATAKEATSALRFNVQVFARDADPGSGGPDPKDKPGCKHEVDIGVVHVTATCLKREGSEFSLEAGGQARVNGIDLFTPESGGTLMVDPLHRRIKATGKVEVQLGPLVLRAGSFDWELSKPIDLSVNKAAKLKGMPVEGSVAIDFNKKDQLVATAHASLGPQFGKITGDVQLHASTKDGVKLDNLRIGLSDSDLRLMGKLAIQSAGVEYTADEDLWRGDAELGLPAGKAVAASLGIADGGFHDASVDVSGLNIPIGQVIFLKSLGANVSVKPLSFGGTASFTAGPSLKVFGRDLSALEGTGSLQYTSGSSYDTYELGGSLALASFDLADAKVTYRTGTDLSFEGGVKMELAKVGFDAQVSGWIEGTSQFQAEGEGHVSLPLLSADGQGMLSSRGAAVCGSKDILFGTLRGGAWYRWGDSTPHIFKGACDYSDVEVERSTSRQVGRPGAQTVRLDRSDRPVLLAIHGANAAPHVQVTGPGGVNLVPGPQGAALQRGVGYLLEVPDERTTYAILAKPTGGDYTVSTLAGGEPPTRVTEVRPHPDVRVRGAVTRRRDGDRVLRWSLKPIKGQEVRFVERGSGVGNTIKVTNRRDGRVSFTPRLGRSGRRTIDAVVLQDGRPRAQIPVASYGYRAPRPRRPTHVRYRRSKGRIITTWRHSGPTTGYDVVVRASDGRRLLRIADADDRRATIRGIAKRHRVKVTIVARGLGSRHAKAVRATTRPRPGESQRPPSSGLG